MNKWRYFTTTIVFIGAYHFYWWMLLSPDNPNPLFLELAAWYPLPFWYSLGILIPFVLYWFFYLMFHYDLKSMPVDELQYPHKSWSAVILQCLFMICVLYHLMTIIPRIILLFWELYQQSIEMAFWIGLELTFLFTQLIAWYLIFNSLVFFFAIREKSTFLTVRTRSL